MDNKHMTIKIFGNQSNSSGYLMWSPVETNQVQVVSSNGWILENESGQKVELEENKKYSVIKNEKYLIHKGHGQLVLGILYNE